MNQEIKLEPIIPSDFEEVSKLAHSNGGSKKFSPTYLQYQYLDKPTGSYSLWKVMLEDSIEGFASTNNFIFNIRSKNVNVAMPQNVLTSEKVRGKGLFNKLYNCTEKENIEQNDINTFLTFTNELSTPIFLKKFGYKEGRCPDVIFYLPRINFLKQRNFISRERVSDLNLKENGKLFSFDNSMQKDSDYYKWRYSSYDPETLKVIEVFQGKKMIGIAILKKETKKGIRFLLLMDIICEESNALIHIIQACRNYAWKYKFAGVLTFKLNKGEYPTTLLKKVFHKRFNFLVKGLTTQDTKDLASLDFNFQLGDLDIF